MGERLIMKNCQYRLFANKKAQETQIEGMTEDFLWQLIYLHSGECEKSCLYVSGKLGFLDPSSSVGSWIQYAVIG